MAPSTHETQAEAGSSRPLPGDEVVISGISGIFPSSDNTQEFMENLFNKVDMVTPVDLQFEHPEVPKYLGKINGTQQFDAQFFRVTYYQAISMEPMSRKLLESAYSAMFDAGVNPVELKGKRVGVYVGSSFSDLTNISLYHTGSDMSNMILSGTAKTMYANRISFWLDGKGPSYLLDCNCSSSLACLELARDAIMTNVCDAAIVGTCNICTHPALTLNFSRAGMLCMDGKTKCFDQSGDGYVRSEAINVIFVQRAKDARRIYAEVYDAKVSYSLPNDAKFLATREPENIVKFLDDFYSHVDVSPNEVEYVEAHGAAYGEADANELKAIDSVFCKDNKVKVGCVKSNMGDSESASGLCAVTKLCLAYHRGELPANLHYSKDQAVPTARDGRVHVVDNNTTFGRGFTAVNNFSFSGMNAHVLLKGHYKPKDTQRYKSSIPRLVLASGRQEECVESLLETLKNQPIDVEQISLLADFFKTDIVGHMCRGYSILDTDQEGNTVSLAQSVDFQSSATRPLWLVYSGMGSQWPAMGAELMKLPIFAAAIHKCHKALEPKGLDLIKILTDPDEAILKNILHSFVGIAAVQIALTDVLKALGIVPDHLMGHSMGEMGCGYFEDCMTTEEMILCAYYRGKVSLDAKLIRSTMAAVGVGYKDILPLCPPEIDVACHNSAESATIAGPADVVQQFMTELKARGIFSKEVASSNIAFHSRYIRVVAPTLLKALQDVIKDPKPRSSKWISTSVPQTEWDSPLAKYCSAEYHTHNSVNPVLFEEALQLIPPNAVIVEVAPHGLMQAILKRSNPECINIPLTRRNHPDPIKFLLDAIGSLYKAGYNPKVSALYPTVEYPVSTETPLLSHLVKWEHSEHWPETVYHFNKNITSSTRNFVISLYDEEYKYLTGHIRNGAIVIPEATLLCLVWETLAMYHGVNYLNLSVTFSNLHFPTEAIMSLTEPLKLTLTINKGNDNFEIGRENTVLASGSVVGIFKPIPFPEITFEDKTEDDELLQCSKIYQLLQLRGFGYKDEFQSISSSTVKGSKAQIKWKENWATFLDSLIQLNILARDHDSVSTPKLIKQLTINTLEQKNFKSILNDNEPTFTAHVDSTCGVTRCAGVEIRHIIFNDKPSMDAFQPAVLETLSFIPHVIEDDVNIDNVLLVQLQIVADNVANDSVKVSCTSSTQGFIKRVSERMPILKFHVNDDNQNGASSDVIVAQNLLQDYQKIIELLQHMDSNVFILSLEQYMPQSLDSNLFTVVSVATINGRAAILLRKVKNDNEEVSYIPITREDSFSWVARVHNEMLGLKRIVLVSERNPNCGSYGLVKRLLKEYNKISLVSTHDSQAPIFDPEHPFYREQLRKMLTFNIFKKGQWGSYYRMPLDSNTSPSMQIISTKPGNLDLVRWMPAPSMPNSSTEIQVCFAAPSMRDSLKAVTSIGGSDHFGMDFSGIDANGKRVMGIVPSGALASHVAGEDAILWPSPSHWSLQESATVPLPYALACYCLVIRAQLLPRHTLLVTGGAGAFGQACIALALRVGATVFATVSNIHKKRMLLHLFPEIDESHIDYAGCGGFTSQFQKKCDIVLNCYSGDLRRTAMKTVKNYGIFLDISDYDMEIDSDFGMAFLDGEKNYMSIRFSNIFRNENAEERKLLHQLVSDGVADGWVRPVPHVELPVDEAARAFKLVAATRLPGRVLLRMPNELPPVAVAPWRDGIALLVGAEEALAMALIKRLVKHGAKHILMQHPAATDLQEFWKKFGVFIGLSSENLETEASCLKFLREGEEHGPIREVYIIQESLKAHNYLQQEHFVKHFKKGTSVVATLDQLTRNNCPELSKFVVITNSSRNAAEEYAASVSESICESRREAGLPALALRVESQDGLVDQKIELYSAIQSTLDTSLIVHHANLIATKLNTSTIPYSQKISKILGIKNIDDIDESLTVDDVTVSDVDVEELRAMIKDTYKIDYTPERLRTTPIASLKQIDNASAVSEVKNATGLDAFYSYVDQDVYMANKAIVPMMSLLNSIGENENQLDAKDTYLVLIPGFEGHNRIYKTMCERLKVRAVTFQLGPDMTHHSVTKMAARAKRVIQRRFEKKSTFYLLGYSFGVNVALELAAMLEKEGQVGVVYCLDSSPDAVRMHLDTYLGDLSDNQLQCQILQHFHRLMTGRTVSDQFQRKIDQLEAWNDRKELFLNSLKGLAIYSSQYASDVVEAAYNRIKLARNYEPDFKLDSEVVLVKCVSASDSTLARLGEDYNLSKYTRRTVKVFDVPANHVEMPSDCRVPFVVNSQLDPELLELFRNTNLCLSYVYKA